MQVLDLSGKVAGAFCAQLLTLSGARVTRIETSSLTRSLVDDPDPLLWEALNRGKSIVARRLDLENVAQTVLPLVEQFDAVVEDWGPDGIEGAGLTEALLRMRNPALILTRVSEFGQEGPWSAWSGSELVNLAAGGLLFLTGPCDRPPVQLAPYQAQLVAGLLASIATAAALYGGGPTTIDLSKQEAIAAMITPALTEYAYTGVIPAREGTVAGMTRIEMASDTWVYAGPSAPGIADYTSFAAFLEISELAEERFSSQERRMEHWEEHQALVVPRIAEKTAAEWIEAAEQWRLTFGHVQTTTDLLACPVLAERSFFAALAFDDGEVRVPLAPYLVNGERPHDLELRATLSETVSE